MEKCGLALSPHCDYCTEVMKETDANWDIKCLETSYHILCKCKYFSTQRASYYYDFKTDANKIFYKNITHNITQMIKFFQNIKIFERPIKLNKNMLSPYKKHVGIQPKGNHLKRVIVTIKKTKRRNKIQTIQ